MRVIILTSLSKGTASHHLPILLDSGMCDVVLVVLSEGQPANQRTHLFKKFRKMLQIGPLGALNGLRMRQWYTPPKVRHLEDICREHGIPFHQTPTINHPQTRALFSSAQADIGISLGNGYIGRGVFSLPKYGMINIHHEWLPDYQNAQSIIWQIYNGSDHSGYTIHRIDKRIDTGDILLRERVPMDLCPRLSDTVVATQARLLDASVRGLIRILGDLAGFLAQALPQGPGRVYTTPGIFSYIRMLIRHRRLYRAFVSGKSIR